MQEHKHKYCASLTMCPGDQRAKDRVCTCIEEVGNMHLEEEHVGFSRFPKWC